MVWEIAVLIPAVDVVIMEMLQKDIYANKMAAMSMDTIKMMQNSLLKKRVALNAMMIVRVVLNLRIISVQLAQIMIFISIPKASKIARNMVLAWQHVQQTIPIIMAPIQQE